LKFYGGVGGTILDFGGDLDRSPDPGVLDPNHDVMIHRFLKDFLFTVAIPVDSQE